MIKHKTREGGYIIYHIWNNTGKYDFTLEQSEENFDVYNLFRIGNSTIIEAVNAFELDDFIEGLPEYMAKIS